MSLTHTVRGVTSFFWGGGGIELNITAYRLLCWVQNMSCHTCVTQYFPFDLVFCLFICQVDCRNVDCITPMDSLSFFLLRRMHFDIRTKVFSVPKYSARRGESCYLYEMVAQVTVHTRRGILRKLSPSPAAFFKFEIIFF